MASGLIFLSGSSSQGGGELTLVVVRKYVVHYHSGSLHECVLSGKDGPSLNIASIAQVGEWRVGARLLLG